MIDLDDSRDLFSGPPEDAATGAVRSGDAAAGSLGQRLRRAREARGLEIAICADQLHLPARVLQRLEADDFGSPEHFVFLRGALHGYAKFLGLPTAACDSALRAAAPSVPPQLVSVAHTSTARWLLQRYGTAATYVILTAFIAVPLVLLGLRGGLERPATRMVSLDQASTFAAPHVPPKVAVASGAATTSPDSTPLRASLAPFAAIGISGIESQTPAPIAAVNVADVPAGQHTLSVTASADCWFEITGADGQKVDSGMLHAGDVRTWHSADPLHVTFGNADGVSVSADGKPIDLAPFRHANVARLDAFGSADGGAESD